MNVPAWAFSNLYIGRTYDAKTNRAGIDIFPPDIPTKTEDVTTFSFRYKKITSNEDVRDLLNISGDISLKIKANIFKVEGAGKYISNSRKDEGTAEVLAVMKCTTVNKTMDGSANAKEEMMTAPSLGTHYVRSVTYGAEMIASLKFKSSSSSHRLNLTGKLDGGLDIQGAVNAGLEAQLKRLTSDCDNASDLSIEYYATDRPDKSPTNLEDLVKLIQGFPSRLEKINGGQGVPIKIELQPIENVYPGLKQECNVQALECDIDEIESRYDDLCRAKSLVTKYRETDGELDEEMRKFNSDITKTLRTFRSAISTLDAEKVEHCLEVYGDALDGNDDEEKFARHWRNMLEKKVPTTNIKLPSGNDLTVVLLGKTGNGKSATGNRILGRNHFKSSGSASNVTKFCRYGSRTVERNVNVIDTPGVLDTSSVKRLKCKPLTSREREDQQGVLTEVYKIFTMAPQGFDAIILVVKYGFRFTKEDEKALKLLQDFLGKEAIESMILILTHGDQAEFDAEEEKKSLDVFISDWIKTMPNWVQQFITDIKDRVVLFNNRLKEEKEPEAFKKQLSQLIEVIDTMNQGKSPFIHQLTEASKEVLDERIREALDSSGFTVEIEKLEHDKEELESQLKDGKLSEEDRVELENELMSINDKIDEKSKSRKALEEGKRQEQALEAEKDSGGEATEKVQKKQEAEKSGGGCFPGSATFVDKYGDRKAMHSMQIGQQVQVIVDEEIRLEPVIAFIHRDPEAQQEFLSITTMANKNLKITGDHLLFVEKEGQASPIPAIDVSIGDTVYVRGDQGAMETDAVQSINPVFEKGVYAPVTLSGTIMVNDVHTSCYFDVLSHEWSHRAMGVARAVYHVSPWILQLLSSIGQEDGFPGWCRLVHKLLTWLE